MSPFALTHKGLNSAFQNAGRYGLVEYHTVQLRLCCYYFSNLNESYLFLVLYAVEYLPASMLQTGVCSYIFRSLLQFYNECYHKKLCDMILHHLLPIVVREAQSRNDGVSDETKFGIAVRNYMACYYMAYSSKEFDFIRNLENSFGYDLIRSNKMIMNLIINSVYEDIRAADYFVASINKILITSPTILRLLYIWCQRNVDSITIGEDIDEYNTILEILVQFWHLKGKLDEKIPVEDVKQYILHSSNVGIYYLALEHLDAFDPESRQTLLFNAFKNYKQLSNIQKMHQSLSKMEIFQSTEGFNFSNLEQNSIYDEIVADNSMDWAHEFEQEILATVRGCYDVFGVENPVVLDPQTPVVPIYLADEDDDTDSKDLCPVCYNPLTESNSVKLKCTHKLCAKCMGLTVTKCVVCRAPLEGFEYQGCTFSGRQNVEPQQVLDFEDFEDLGDEY